MPLKFDKGRSRASEKRADKRVAAKIIRSVRAACVQRDGYCRILHDYGVDFATAAQIIFLLCHGESEWAHLNESKRFKTRGKPAAERHTTMGSLMLCQRHHRAYDAGEFQILELSDRGADGPLQFTRG